MSSGEESNEPITVESVRQQLSDMFARLPADNAAGHIGVFDANMGMTMSMPVGVPLGIPVGIPMFNNNISGAIGVPAPRNYEFDHLRKLSTAQLFQLDNALANLIPTQSGMAVAHTHVCRNRIETVLGEKI